MRRDKVRIRGTFNVGAGGAAGGGGGGGTGGVVSHAALLGLAYADAGHTGFAPIDNPTFTTKITTPTLKVTTGAAAGNILISDAAGDLSYLAAGALTKILVGGGAAAPVWTEASGTGAPIRAGSPTFSGIVTMGGAANNWTTFIQANDTANQSYGLKIHAGTSSSDVALQIKNRADNTHFMTILGDGKVGFGFDAPLSALCVNGGLHVGGESAAGDNNLIVDGTLLQTGIATFGDDLGTSSFSSGFAGSGWKLDKETDYSFTVDNLTVRKLMRIYELEINKISSVNGGILVSVANGKVYSVGNIFTSWTNFSFETFVSKGLEITSCINTGGGGALAYTITGHAFVGEVITITYTATINSGTAPNILIHEDDVKVVTTQILTGVNNIVRTVGTTGSFVIGINAYLLADCDISLANVSITSDSRIIFDEDNGNKQIQFIADDYIKAQEWTGRGTDIYEGQVIYVHHSNTLGQAYIIAEDDESSVAGRPWDGCDLVQVGNSTDVNRQSIIYITASDDNNPYIDMLAGVNDGVFAGKQKLRIGNLTGITDADLGGDLDGYGLYSDNAYLKGKLVADTGYIGGTSGWVIASGSISSVNAGNTTIMASGGTNAYISGTTGSPQFKVTHAGALTAVGNCEFGSATGTVSLGSVIEEGTVTVWSKILLWGEMSIYNYSAQSTNTLSTTPSLIVADHAAETTITLPDIGTESGKGKILMIIHPTGTGSGIGKFHIDGNGSSFNNYSGTEDSIGEVIDVDEGHSVLFAWDGRGGEWHQLSYT